MKTPRQTLLIAALFATAVPMLGAGDNKFPAAMTGPWQGQAKIIVVWCQQKELPLNLQISPNGSVTGTIGDAKLKHGHLARNRGWLGRRLNIKTDYIITGELEGAIVAAEQISRQSVSIPLNFRDNAYSGGLATSGSKAGSKESMKLTAADLVLQRAKTD